MRHQQLVIRTAGVERKMFRHTLLGPIRRGTKHDLLVIPQNSLSDNMLNWPEPGIYRNRGICSVTRELKKTLADYVLTGGYGLEGLLGKRNNFTPIEDAR